MKLFSEEFYGKIKEVEVEKGSLIKAIHEGLDIVANGGEVLEFWGKRTFNGMATFKMDCSEVGGGDYSFHVIFDADNFRYESRPKNTVVELNEESFEFVENTKQTDIEAGE